MNTRLAARKICSWRCATRPLSWTTVSMGRRVCRLGGAEVLRGISAPAPRGRAGGSNPPGRRRAACRCGACRSRPGGPGGRRPSAGGRTTGWTPPRSRWGNASSRRAAAQGLHEGELLLVLPHLDLTHVLLEQEGAGPGEVLRAHALPALEALALPLGGAHVEAVEPVGAIAREHVAEHLGHEEDDPVVERAILAPLLLVHQR